MLAAAVCVRICRDHATSCHIMPHHATSCHIMPHHVTSCCIMPHHATSHQITITYLNYEHMTGVPKITNFW